MSLESKIMNLSIAQPKVKTLGIGLVSIFGVPLMIFEIIIVQQPNKLLPVVVDLQQPSKSEVI